MNMMRKEQHGALQTEVRLVFIIDQKHNTMSLHYVMRC